MLGVNFYKQWIIKTFVKNCKPRKHLCRLTFPNKKRTGEEVGLAARMQTCVELLDRVARGDMHPRTRDRLGDIRLCAVYTVKCGSRLPCRFEKPLAETASLVMRSEPADRVCHLWRHRSVRRRLHWQQYRKTRAPWPRQFHFDLRFSTPDRYCAAFNHSLMPFTPPRRGHTPDKLLSFAPRFAYIIIFVRTWKSTRGRTTIETSVCTRMIFLFYFFFNSIFI